MAAALYSCVDLIYGQKNMKHLTRRILLLSPVADVDELWNESACTL